MKIIAKPCYGLDLLCLMNTMTGDAYYLKHYQEVYDRYGRDIPQDVKDAFARMVAESGSAVLSPALTLLASAVPGFDTRDVVEVLRDREAMTRGIGASPYDFTPEELQQYYGWFDTAVIPMIQALHNAGHAEDWAQERLPQIQGRCAEVEAYAQEHDIGGMIDQLRGGEMGDITIYMCSYARPHGIKLCGDALISDISYRLETVIANVTHEVFHPPYTEKDVRAVLDAMARQPFVLEAFEGQNPMSGYGTMDGFLEENIVEALGTYIVYQLGIETDPDAYFHEHDGGSHVVSPHFFWYLVNTPKPQDEAFAPYLARFVADMGWNG